ncbi:MAG: PAS domain-containing sensor histidine kinase [Cyclobacteriaceae bacterium]|nr:PAS domain-containing sensor histidine kinase [Cyclobacteriaceae bacterium]
MKHALRNFLLGSERIPSRVEYKFAMLRGEFALIIFSVATFYVVLDWSNNVFAFMPWYGVMFVIGAVVIILNRNGFYGAANLCILLPVNALVYMFADVDQPQGGVYFFFLNASVAGLILFSDHPRATQLAFGFLPIGLGLFARLYDTNLIAPPLRTPEITQINFLANFAIGLLSSIFIVQFVISRNRESERSLIASEQAMIKASEDLKQSEERYSLALKGSRAGIYEWDVARNKVQVSDHWKVLLGYGPGETVHVSLETFLDMVHPDDVQRTSESIQRHMRDHTPYQNEVRLRTKGGVFKWFQDTGIGKTDHQGNLTVVIGSIIDIDERKQAEAKILSQNDLLAKANKELDYFVYSVSHDLRAPLSSILGLTSIYPMAKDDGERQEIIKMVSDRAQVLDAFIREVLDYSRNSRLELTVQRFKLIDVVHEVLYGLKHMDGFSATSIYVEIPTELEIVTDRERSKVVFSNLFANAIHYRDHGKQSFVKINAFADNGHVLMDIEDNGIGIKPEHHQRIFDMFYKAHDHSKGTGLGLYIVRETLQRLKGEIDVRSEYGKGTLFRIRIQSQDVA